MSRLALWLILLIFAMLHTAPVRAQTAPTSGELQHYRPASDGSGLLNVQLASPGMNSAARVGIHFVGATELFTATVEGSEAALGSIVNRRYDAMLVGSFSLLQRIDIGFVLPYVLDQSGLDTDLVRSLTGKDGLSSGGLGDVRLMLKGTLVTEYGARPAVAIGAEIDLPTGDPEELFGERGAVYAPFLAVSKKFGPHVAGLNLGYRVRPDATELLGVEVSDTLFYRAGFAYAIDRRRASPRWNALLSLAGHSPVGQPFGLGAGDRESVLNYLEVNGGLQRRIALGTGSLRVSGSLGTGLSSGAGSPQIRFGLGIEYVTAEPLDDADRDRFANASDLCPYEPEDYDGFQDGDGCPEPDDDQDGVLDIDDGCPNEPEDLDGFEDYDGCPEVSDEDSDGDGVSDANDRCPDEREDIDGFEDTDGCPEPDNDQDGLKDINDLCPYDYEDQSTSPDKDGCPGTSGDVLDEATVYARQIIAPTAIEFQGRQRGFTPESRRALDTIARFLRDHPEIVRVAIRVNVNGKGEGAKRLAQLRARAVRNYLASRGVEAERMSAELGAMVRGTVSATLRIRKVERESPKKSVPSPQSR